MAILEEKKELAQVVEHFLRALRFRPPGDRLSFFWNRENPGIPIGGRAYEFYFDHDLLQHAALTLLNSQADLLSGTPLQEVRSILLGFFRAKLHLFDADALMWAHRSLTTASEMTHLNRDQIVSALYAHLQKVREVRLYLIPAKRLSVEANYVGSRVLLLRPSDNLNDAFPSLPFTVAPLNGLQFPPFKHDKAEGELGEQDSWLGCFAKSDQDGKNLLESLLGAISLMLPPLYSRTFSMADRIPYTYCLGGQWIARLGEPTFPPLICDHALGVQEVQGLVALLEGSKTDEEQRRLEVGLQFVGAGWEPPSRLSFLHNAIAFDAFFGQKGQVNASIKDAVVKLAAGEADAEDRISRLLRIRNALLHGEVGTVEASPEYISYYESFGADPQRDQVSLLRACVRKMAGMN